MNILFFAIVATVLGTPAVYVATHGGIMHKNQTILMRREKLVLYLQLSGIVFALCLAYGLLIIWGAIDDQFSSRRIPIHFLWAFFGIPVLSIAFGNIWYRYRFRDKLNAGNS